MDGITNAEYQTVLDMDLAKKVAERLHKDYPGHLWAVNVRDGVCVIKNLRVSTQYGYVLYTTTIDADPDMKCVMKAGGEILERAAMARKRYEEGDQAVRVEGMKQKYQPIAGMII